MPKIQKDIRHEIASLRHNQYFLAILVLLFVSIIVWTSVSIVTSQKETRVSPKLQLLAKPLTPSISTEVIDNLESKREYSETELAKFPIYKIIVSQDGRNQRVVTIDTPEAEINSFTKSTRRTAPSPSPSSIPILNGPTGTSDTPNAGSSTTTQPTPSSTQNAL